ncbi:MAG: hypothetical protein IKY78_01670 [Clostridia bacterium]|nr:hypothetical protein [Clostridia bacterium]
MKRREERPAPSEGIVAHSKLVLIVGIVCTAFFGFCAVASFMTEAFGLVPITFLAFAALGMALIVSYVNQKITYNPDGFVVTSFFGKKQSYSYRDVTAFLNDGKNLKLYIGKKKITLDESFVGKRDFISFVQKQYSKYNNGKALPKALTNPRDLFNGKIADSGSMLFAYIMMLALCLAGVILVLVIMKPYSAEVLEYKNLRFDYCAIDDKALQLYVQGDDMPYEVPEYLKTMAKSEELISVYRNGESFYVGYKAYPDADDPYYRAVTIEGSDGTIYLSLDESNEYQKKNKAQIMMLFGGFLLFWLVYVIASIYVGRNAEKFSLRFLSLFFKKSYILVSKDSKSKN